MYNKVELCGVNTAELPILSEQEKRDLLTRARAGDKKARQSMIEGNLRLVLSVVQRFSQRGENMDDLFQVGCIGLIKAIDNFDKTDAPHLKQIVGVLAPAAEPLDHRQHQPEIAPDQPLTGRHIPLLGAPEKLHHLVVFQDLQPGCIDPADFHLPLHTPPPPLG